jgi:ribosomal protein S18 acetylase RimI-like enzyme
MLAKKAAGLAMPEAAIEIRPARKADAAAMAVLVDIAGHGMPAYMWAQIKAPGQSVLEIGRARALRDTGSFSWRNAFVAESDGEVAALLVDYLIDDPYVIGDLSQMPEFIHPLVRLEAQAPGTWYVNVLATFPEFRGKGLGAKLLALSEIRGNEHGSRKMSIIVAGENPDAMRLYGRTGYVEVAREAVVEFPGCPHGGDWVLMTKELTHG